MTPPPTAPPGRDQRRPAPVDGAEGPGRFIPVVGPEAGSGRSPLRALGAAAALVLLLAGVPAALIWLAGPLSWPGSLPGRDDLTGNLGTEQLLAVLLVVAWLAWAQFVVCVVVEVVAARRGGVLAAPLPFSGLSQRLARALVASVLVAGTIAIQSGTAFAAPPAPAQPTVSAPAQSAPAQSTVSAPAQAVFAPGGVVAQSPAPPTAQIPVTSGPEAGAGPAVTGVADAHLDASSAELASSTHRSATGIGEAVAIGDDAALDGHRVYVVEAPAGRHHDSLWAIAERHLGDGRRYHEIFALNDGRRQHDGRTLHLARLIQPGWQLIMPEDATGVPRYIARAPAGRTPPADDSRAGSGEGSGRDSSSPGAGAASPGAAAAPAVTATAADGIPGEIDPLPPPLGLAAPTAQITSPGGTASPGPQSAVPSRALQATPPQTRAVTPAPTQAAPAAQAQPSTPAQARPATTAADGVPGQIDVPPPPLGLAAPASPAPSPATAEAPSPAARQEPVPGSTTARATASQPAPATASQPAPATGSRSPGGWPGAELLGAGLLGAGLLGALLVVRRRRGGVTPDDPAAEAEVWLRAGADPDRGTLLDRALRTIGGSCQAANVPLPQVYGAVVDNEGMDLLLSAPQPGAPYPWHDLGGGARWRLAVADGDQLPADGESAYPLLASVGRDDQGRDALINLGAAGGPVTVLGSPAMASAVVRALALALAGNPWSRGIEVLTCDLPDTLPTISAGRLVSCPDAANLTGQLEDGTSHLARPGPARVLTGGPAPGSRPERVAVYGQALDPAIARRVEDLSRSGSQLAVLMTGELPAARWRLRVDDTGRLDCEELSLSVTAHRLGDGSIERLHSLFTAAAQPVPRPALIGGDRPSMTPPVLEADDITWAQAGARLALLGEVEVRAPGPADPARTDLLAEVVCYLALHPAGAHPTVLGSAIWPRGVTADVREATLEQVRDWMGTDPDGQYRVRTGHDGRVRLSPSVICDWDVLRTLLGRAHQAPAVSRERDLLVRALHLVRGPVAGGPGAGPYSWLARTDLEHQAEDLILDAADRLSQICVEEGDHVGVAQAAAAGLRASPAAQELWRHILRAEHALGGPSRLDAVVDHLTHALSAEGVDVEPQTQALIDHLRAPSGALPSSQQNSAS